MFDRKFPHLSRLKSAFRKMFLKKNQETVSLEQVGHTSKGVLKSHTVRKVSTIISTAVFALYVH